MVVRVLRRINYWSLLIAELAVGVLSKECLADGRGGGVFEKTQPSLEGVVDIDLAVAAHDDDATSPGER
jgi:hypothetical protein